MLTFAIKLTAFLFTPIIVAVFLLFLKNIKNLKYNNKMVMLLLLAIIVMSGITYRTVLLTGFPTYKAGIEFYKQIGFKAKKYFDISNNYSMKNVFMPERIIYCLLMPNESGKIAAQWIGNFYLFFYILFLKKNNKNKEKKNSIYTILLVLSIILIITSIYFLITMPAPDGNYFVVPIIAVALCCFYQYSKFVTNNIIKRIFHVFCFLFIFTNFIFGLVTHPSWNCGTRFSDEPIEISLGNLDADKINDKAYDNMGVSKIAAYLKNNENLFIIADSNFTDLARLNMRVELSNYLLRKDVSGVYLENYEEFIEYMNYVHCDGFILDNNSPYNEEFSKYAHKFLREKGYEFCIEDNKSSFFKLNKY